MKTPGRVGIGRFLGRYFKRYIPWLLFATFAAALYAIFTGVAVALIKAVFSEVLLADGARSVGAAMTTSMVSPGVTDAAGATDAGAAVDATARFGDSIRQLPALAFAWIKQALGIHEGNAHVMIPLLMVLVILARSVAAFLSGYSFRHIGLGATTDVRNELYEALLAQSSRFHARHPSGELISRVVNDVGLMQTAVSTRVADLALQSLTLVALIIVLLMQNTGLALVCLVLLPAVLYPIVRFGQGLRRTSHTSQERMADLANLVGDGIRGHRVVKAFGMEDFENRRFRHATRLHLKVNLRATMLDNLSSPVIETIGVLGLSLLLVYAGREIRLGEMSAASFVAFLTCLIWMYEPIRRLNKVNLVIQQSLAAVRRVADVMAESNEIQEKPGAERITGVSEGLTFEDVSFAYSDQVVLHDVNLNLKHGEVLALVGPSGAGKSTIVNLVPRLFDPDAGCVRIDGIDVRDLTVESLRSLIGIVTQETILFNDTIRNNIAYGRSDLSIERIREAAAAAYADEFISRLSHGYDTVIGESGLHLSGGQRQRLAIARALVKDPPILILDEATSQLDSESEALVQRALGNLMQGRTTLVIAHRLSTVQQADRIVVLDAGHVVEEGRHAELLARGGLYKRLYDLQFQE